MAGPKTRILVDLLEEHFEEFAFLWRQRAAAVRSPRHTLAYFLDLEERIDARVDGLLVSPEHAALYAMPGLDADEADDVFRAGYLLLRVGTEDAVGRVLDVFARAEGPKLLAIRDAVCQAGLSSFAPLEKLVSAGNPVAAGAALALACHDRLKLPVSQWEVFAKHTDAEVRKTAWRIAHRVNPAPSSNLFQSALRDPDIRTDVILAAAVNRQMWLLDHLRQEAQKASAENWEVVRLFAVFAKPADVELVSQLVRNASLGPRRFELAGVLGQAELVPILLEAMANPDVPTSVAAAQAFTRITGLDVDSQERREVPAESEKDDFDKEFRDQVSLPDVALARDFWSKSASRFPAGKRWNRGADVTQMSPPAQVTSLDMQARWDLFLRSRWQGDWDGDMERLGAFPLK